MNQEQLEHPPFSLIKKTKMFSIMIILIMMTMILSERNREYEKQREEERLRKFGCPIMRAERNFFTTVSQLRREREDFYNEVRSQIEG